MIKPVWKGKNPGRLAPLALATEVQIDSYEVVARAVESGVQHGYRRARKHGKPNEGAACNAIYRSVMDELSQVLRLGVGRQQ